MVQRRSYSVLMIVLVGGCGASRPSSPDASRSVSAPLSQADDLSSMEHLVSRSELCVTAGRLHATGPAEFSVDAGGMRADASGGNGHAARLSFRYLGPSSSTKPLANGEVRRQIGLRLHAHDTCNVVYVMWHIAPTAGIFVSVKRNPGMHTHAECGAVGYINVRPTATRALPPVAPDERHTLRADIAGRLVRVTADGVPAWEGALPEEAFTFDGPAGVRSDNGAFEFKLWAAGSDEAFTSCDRARTDRRRSPASAMDP